jgi:hypothetical protein
MYKEWLVRFIETNQVSTVWSRDNMFPTHAGIVTIYVGAVINLLNNESFEVIKLLRCID